jgi:hypothetical protein
VNFSLETADEREVFKMAKGQHGRAAAARNDAAYVWTRGQELHAELDRWLAARPEIISALIVREVRNLNKSEDIEDLEYAAALAREHDAAWPR